MICSSKRCHVAHIRGVAFMCLNLELLRLAHAVSRNLHYIRTITALSTSNWNNTTSKSLKALNLFKEILKMGAEFVSE